MSTFSSVVREGIARVWEEDRESQENFLRIVAEARGTKPEFLKKVNSFFVPNEQYMIKYFSEEITLPEYDCYSPDGLCKWSNQLVIPICNVVMDPIAFVGFNPFIYVKTHEPDAEHENYYMYSSKNVFHRGKFIYTPMDSYRDALRDGYIFVVDGMFDSISLKAEGFNSASMLGSTVTAETAAQLKLIDRVILIHDNDKAGLELLGRLQRYLPHIETFKQGKFKDIDECLTSEYREEIIQRLKQVVCTPERFR